jgi:DNA-binding transcriptional MerR regulator
MASLLTIGDFARVTHLSVKALRHYDDIGLLAPADVDAASGYRRYAVAQVPVAQVIRRFRDLEMPLDRIKEVLSAPDRDARDRLVLDHLEQMQTKLDETRATVAALQELLEGRLPTAQIEHRMLPAIPVVTVRGRVDWDDAERWLGDALAEIVGVIETAGGARVGPDGALYSEEFFEQHHGEVVAFVPVAEQIDAAGGDALVALPARSCAVMEHRGPFSTLDITYGALGRYVTERGIGVPGPIRETYLAEDADNPGDLVTEVCWPVRE